MKKFKSVIIFCGPWKLCEIKISVSLNKLLLEYSHDYLIMYCPCGFYPATAELNKRPYDPQSLKYLQSGSSQKIYADLWHR